MRSDTRRSHQPESSRHTEETRRENENITITVNATGEDLQVLRLTASGEPDNPEVGSTRERYVLRRRNTAQNRKIDGGA